MTLFKINSLILFFNLIITFNIFAQNIEDSNNDPWNFYDFGGTPDLQSDRELTLSENELGELIKNLESDVLTVIINAAEEIMRNAEGTEKILKKFLWKGPFPGNAQLKDALKKASALSDENNYSELIDNLLKATSSEASAAALKIIVMLNALNSLN
ncbi:MAG: hypothetical protein JXR91_13355, partial [Deltaproteobacteria bacterium]|nr:hypothetical protein [Deltaproteobacteria bacterium]